MGPYAGKHSGEPALFRTLLGSLESGDIVLADRYYASYWMIALLRERGVDSLFRQHHQRCIDFRTGRRLGKDDHLITLTRPRARADWMDQASYARMPEQLTVREVRVRVTQAGFRVRQMVLVTTLLDAQLYNRQEIAQAFRLRWHAELDLRAIKQTMHMSGDPGGLPPGTPAALQDATDGAQRDLDASAGLQPDPRGDGRGGPRGRHRTAAGELCRGGAGCGDGSLCGQAQR